MHGESSASAVHVIGGSRPVCQRRILVWPASRFRMCDDRVWRCPVDGDSGNGSPRPSAKTQGCAAGHRAGLQGSSGTVSAARICRSWFAARNPAASTHCRLQPVRTRPQLPSTRPHPSPPKKPELRTGQGHLLRPLFPAAPGGREVPASNTFYRRGQRRSQSRSRRSAFQAPGDAVLREARLFDRVQKTTYTRDASLPSVPSCKSRPLTRATRAGSEWHGRGGAIWRGIGELGASQQHRRRCGMMAVMPIKRGRVGQAARHLAHAD